MKTSVILLWETFPAWRWDIETYASRFNVKSETKKERQAQEILESTTRFTEGRFEVGLLWNKPNAKLPNNYSAALGNLKSLERRLSKDPQLKQMYQDTIDKDEEKGFIKKLSREDLKTVG